MLRQLLWQNVSLCCSQLLLPHLCEVAALSILQSYALARFSYAMLLRVRHLILVRGYQGPNIPQGLPDV